MCPLEDRVQQETNPAIFKLIKSAFKLKIPWERDQETHKPIKTRYTPDYSSKSDHVFNILNICATLFKMLHHCMTCNVHNIYKKMLLTSNH